MSYKARVLPAGVPVATGLVPSHSAVRDQLIYTE